MSESQFTERRRQKDASLVGSKTNEGKQLDTFKPPCPPGLTIELLLREMKVNDDQLNSQVEEFDLPELAACFDNTEDYVEKLQLSPGQQTDVIEVKATALLNRTQTGMKVALKYWRNRNPVEATFKALLLVLLSLTKGDVAIQVCKYLLCKHDLSSGNVNQPESTPVQSEKPPVLTLDRHFSNLGVSNLSEAQLREIGTKLYLESSELVCKFNKLCTSLYFSLKKNTESKEDLVACLMSLDTFEPVFSKSTNQPVFGDQKAKLFEAENLHEVWYIISHYHSYFNYYIVEHIIEYLGTDTDKQNLSSYKESFAQYAKRRVYECPAEFGYENPEDCTIIVKLDKSYDNCNLHQLELLRTKLCEILKLSSSGALKLVQVKHGCYELTFQAPAFIQGIVFPLSPEQEALLRGLNVLWLLCGEYKFISQENDNSDDHHSGDDKDDDDDYPDDTSQVTSLLERVSKDSPGSMSDSGVGKSDQDTFASETMSLITECTEDAFDMNIPMSGSEPVPEKAHSLPSVLDAAAYNGDLLQVKYCLEVLFSKNLLLKTYVYRALNVATDGCQLDILKYLFEELACSLYPHITISLLVSEVSPLHSAALNGSLPLVKYLIEAVKIDPLLPNSQQKTPLHLASRNGSIEVVDYLLEQAQQNDPLSAIFGDKTKLGSTVLHFAAASGNCQLVEHLISFNLDPNTPGQLQATPLLVAAQEGHYEIVEYLTKLKDIRMNCTLHKTNQNALHIAASRGHLPIVKFLIDIRKFDPNVKDSAYRTPLHLAAQCGSLCIIKYLIESCKCDMYCLAKEKKTPLHFAASAGHLNIVEYFIERKKIKPLLGHISSITPLHLALQANKISIVTYYIGTLKCNLNTPDKLGDSLLATAVNIGNYAMTKYIHSQLNVNWILRRSSYRRCMLLAKAVEKGYLNILKYFIIDCQWQAHHPKVPSLLNAACVYGHLDIVRFFISKKLYSPLDPDTDNFLMNNMGYTPGPLHCAAMYGHCDIARYLVEECKADPLYGANRVGTALHFAVFGRHFSVVEYFIFELNVSPNMVDKDGQTPLHIACSNGSSKLVSLLLDVPDCNHFALDVNQSSPIMLAIYSGHLEVVDLMIKSERYNFLLGNNSEDTLLHYAASVGNLEIVKYLQPAIQNSANISLSNTKGVTPFHLACSQGHFQIANYLSPRENITKLVDSNHKSPLHYAVESGNLAIVKWLVKEKGHDPLCTDINGYAPFHTAREIEIVQWFFSELGLDPNTRVCDTKGLTCLHIACSKGREAIVKYLVGLPSCNKLCCDLEGNSCLHLASFTDQFKIVKFLTSTDCCDILKTNIDGETPLLAAIRYKHLKSTKLLVSAHLEKQANFKATNANDPNFEITILHYACHRGSLAIVKYLLDEINDDFTSLINKSGQNPLHSAVHGSNIDIIDYLIHKNPDSRLSTDENGMNILHLAANIGHLTVVTHIIEKLMLDPLSQSGSGATALHIACRKGSKNLVIYLLTKCKKDIRENMEGYMSIHFAAFEGHLHIIKLLLHFFKNSMIERTFIGDTPCHLAAHQGYEYVVNFFTQALDQDPFIQNYQGDTVVSLLNLAVVEGRMCTKELALHRAAERGSTAAVKYLLEEEKYDPNCCDSLRRTPLHYAVLKMHDDAQCIEYLLKAGANVFVEDIFHNLPLHYAAALGQAEGVKFLIGYESPFTTRGLLGMTPLDMAIAGGHADTIQLLNFFTVS